MDNDVPRSNTRKLTGEESDRFSFPVFQFARRSITFYSMGKPEINIDILRTIMWCVLCCFEGFPRDALLFFSSFLFWFYHFLLLKLRKPKLERLETFSRQQTVFPGVQVIASSRLPSPFTFVFLNSVEYFLKLFLIKNILK